MKDKEIILIAGGTGLTGQELAALWKHKGHTVRILSRGSSDPGKGIFQWDPQESKIDEAAIENVTVLVNLSGAGIGDKRWTRKRKQELFNSRIQTTEFLRAVTQSSTTLRHYITASGAVCYGFSDDSRLYTEKDPFGTDLLSEITRAWEAAADHFQPKCLVTKMRMGIVLSAKGGALPAIAKPIRYGFGAVLGTGKQAIPWIHIDDLTHAYDFVIEQQLEGVYTISAGNTDNATFTRKIATVLKKPLWLPRIPAGLLKLVLGERATVVLKGLKVDNSLIRSTGFAFQHTDLENALREIYTEAHKFNR